MKKVSIIPAVALLGAVFMVLTPHTSGKTVRLRSYRYAPASIRIERGGAISFLNDSKTTHTASCVGCSIDSGDIQPGLTKTITFSKAGTYRIACRYHSQLGMAMIVQVGAPSSAASSPSPSAS